MRTARRPERWLRERGRLVARRCIKGLFWCTCISTESETSKQISPVQNVSLFVQMRARASFQSSSALQSLALTPRDLRKFFPTCTSCPQMNAFCNVRYQLPPGLTMHVLYISAPCFLADFLNRLASLGLPSTVRSIRNSGVSMELFYLLDLLTNLLSFLRCSLPKLHICTQASVRGSCRCHHLRRSWLRVCRQRRRALCRSWRRKHR